MNVIVSLFVYSVVLLTFRIVPITETNIPCYPNTDCKFIIPGYRFDIWLRLRLGLEINSGFHFTFLKFFQEIGNTRNMLSLKYRIPKCFMDPDGIPHGFQSYMLTTLDYAEYFLRRDKPFLFLFVEYSKFDADRRQRYLRYFSYTRTVSSIYRQYLEEKWSYAISGFVNMHLCYAGMVIDYTCPNPCRRPLICQDDLNTLGPCKIEKFDRPSFRWRLGPRLNKFKTMFNYKAVCICMRGYNWNGRKCVLQSKPCSVEYNAEPCRNGGQCMYISDVNKRPHPFLTHKCVCPALWKGIVCEIPRNPCLDYRTNPCGQFPCKRNAENLYNGYTCVCSAGYRQRSLTDPTCIDIDECLDEPCQHGGLCINMKVDPTQKTGNIVRYRCSCVRGFTGEHCELPPPETEWSTWGEWSSCSLTCGIGMMTRKRNCSEEGQCYGRRMETSTCIVFSATCDQERVLETRIDKKNAEAESKIIADAFHLDESVMEVESESLGNIVSILSLVVFVVSSLLIIPCLTILLGGILNRHVNRQNVNEKNVSGVRILK